MLSEMLYEVLSGLLSRVLSRILSGMLYQMLWEALCFRLRSGLSHSRSAIQRSAFIVAFRLALCLSPR